MRDYLVRPFIVLVIVNSLAGCASIVTGTTQQLAVNSTPAGAQCELKRNGENLGSVQTPNKIELSKSAYPISVGCAKQGLQGHAVVHSGLQAATFGNALIGGVVGVGVDIATGAAHEYPSEVTVTLQPEGKQAPVVREKKKKDDEQPVS